MISLRRKIVLFEHQLQLAQGSLTSYGPRRIVIKFKVRFALWMYAKKWDCYHTRVY